MDVHQSALKHGIDPEDIEHFTRHATAIEELDDDLRLYLGPARNGALLEVITIIRDDDSGLAIHAMTMRPKYQPLLGGE